MPEMCIVLPFCFFVTLCGARQIRQMISPNSASAGKRWEEGDRVSPLVNIPLVRLIPPVPTTILPL